MPSRLEAASQTKPGARERIFATAYELFSRRGVRDVGVDEVIERAGVAKASLYRHFASKDDLVIAFLQLREERWTLDWVEAEARRRGPTPEEQLLAIFELFDEQRLRGLLLHQRAARDGFRASCRKASVEHLENIRAIVRTLAEEAALRDAESFAHSWHILMKGSIVSAAEGDADAAKRARSMARALIEQHR